MMINLNCMLSTNVVQSRCPNPVQKGVLDMVRALSIEALILSTRVPCPKGVLDNKKDNKLRQLMLSTLSTLLHRACIPNGQGSILGVHAEYYFYIFPNYCAGDNAGNKINKELPSIRYFIEGIKMMQKHDFFNVLDSDRLKRNIEDWVKKHPYIQKIELFGPAGHARAMQDEEIVWEYKFVLVVTVLATIGPPEKGKKSIWDYYNTIGDSPAFWPHKAIFLDSYKNLADRNIYDWRWVSIRQEDDHAGDILDFWADREGSVLLYDAN